MKNKSFAVFSLSLLAVLILTSFASATIAFTDISTLPISSGSHTIDITITPTGEVINSTSITDLTQSGNTIDLSVSSTATPNIYAISYNIPGDFSFYFGKTYSVTLTATGNVSSNATQTLYFEVNNPSLNAGYFDDGNLDISIDDINVKGYGEDFQWYPLDEITAKINVDNNGNDKIKNIVVKYGLYDKDTGKWIFTDSQSSFSLNDGDSKSLAVDFKLDSLSKFKIDDNYVFYTWATGNDEEFDGNKTSISSSEDIEMQFDNNLVTLDNIQIPTSANCGQDVQITADVANIGSDDQSNVYVLIINTKLGVNKKVQIGDINSLETSSLDFSFSVPSDTEEGNYPIEMIVYDDSDDPYQSDLNDNEARFVTQLKVEGACSTVPTASVAASLESDAKAGQELDVKAIIVNTGSTSTTFTVGLSGYADWSSLGNIDKTSFTLAAGASQEVTIKLNVNKDVSGDKNFNLVLTQGDKILTQPVKVTIAQSSIFSGITGFFSGTQGSNGYLWVVIGANVLLVLGIIFVAARIAKKKE